MGNDLMMKTMMKTISQILPEREEPTNEISVFVSEKISEMVTEPEIADLFKTVFISYANKDPQTTYKTLIKFANDISDLNRRMIADIEVEDVEGPEGEPELDDRIDIEAEENTCANCGEKIMPGEEWYTGHEEVDDPFCSEQCAADYIMKCIDMVEGED